MPHIRFSLAGPFAVSCAKQSANALSKRIESKHVANFLQDEDVAEVAGKQGCYIFALRVGKGHTPWYVGKTSIALSAEIFTPDKLNKYNGVLYDDKKGTPVMFFVTRTDGRKSIPELKLHQLEKFLIQRAYMKNPALINTAHTKNMALVALHVAFSKPSENSLIFKNFAEWLRYQ